MCTDVNKITSIEMLRKSRAARETLYYNQWTKSPGFMVYSRVTGVLPHDIWAWFMFKNYSKPHGIAIARAVNRCSPGHTEFECACTYHVELANVLLDNLLLRVQQRIDAAAGGVAKNAQAGICSLYEFH